jgi:hypothetical protein
MPLAISAKPVVLTSRASVCGGSLGHTTPTVVPADSMASFSLLKPRRPVSQPRASAGYVASAAYEGSGLVPAAREPAHRRRGCTTAPKRDVTRNPSLRWRSVFTSLGMQHRGLNSGSVPDRDKAGAGRSPAIAVARIGVLSYLAPSGRLLGSMHMACGDPRRLYKDAGRPGQPTSSAPALPSRWQRLIFP